MEHKAYILLVDDRKENLLALKAVLESPEFNIITATSGNEALGLMLEYDFAVVILDVQMPDMDGFEVAELMRKNEKTKFIPIIFVTAISKDDDYIFKGYETGAVDYLFKPLNPVILKSKISIFLELDRDRKELETSKRKIEKQNERLKELSITDGLTGLYNHRYFKEILNREFALVKRNRSDLSCFMLDLDYFKEVNDTFGHTFGDFVLRRFSHRLKEAIRKTDILARYGGEEFAVLLPHTSLEGAMILAEKFRKNAEDCLYENDGYSRQVTVSVGVSSYNTHHPLTCTDLVSFADQALYRAKAEGRNQVRIYNEDALLEADTLRPSRSNPLIGLRKKLKNIMEKTTENAISALETLIPIPQTDEEHVYHQEYNQRNQQILEVFDLMSARMELPRTLQQTLKRTTKLNNLIKSLSTGDTLFKDEILQGEIVDYSVLLEELAHMFDIFSNERTILRSYRENYDGTGTPEGLRGTEIPLGARLFSLLLEFITMTSDRQFHQVTPAQIIDKLVNQAGRQFDPFLVGCLLDVIAEKELLPVSKEVVQAAKDNLRKRLTSEAPAAAASGE